MGTERSGLAPRRAVSADDGALTPARVAAVQPSAGNALVARRLASRRAGLPPASAPPPQTTREDARLQIELASIAAQRSGGVLARRPAVITKTRGAGLHKESSSGLVREGGRFGTGRKLKIPDGALVDVDDTRQRSDSGGDRYVRVTYSQRSGWVRAAYIGPALQPPPDEESVDEEVELEVESSDSETSDDTASSASEDADASQAPGPRKLLPGPKAGFELEFKEVLVFPVLKTEPQGHDNLRLFWNLVKAGTGNRPIDGHLTTIKHGAKPYFKKRDVIFRAPNKTWSATTDTSISWASNLELVGAALTPEEMESEEAAHDWKVLEAVVAKLRAGQTQFQTIADLHAELIEPRDAVMIVMSRNNTSDHVQLTEAVMLEPATDPGDGWKGEWLPGLNPAAWPTLKHLIGALRSRGYFGNNPKNVFGEKLPKTSVLQVLGRPDETVTEKRRAAWVRAVAESAGIEDLERPVAEELAAKTKGRPEQLEPPPFTWNEFLLGLLDGKDLAAEWAKDAFGGEDDFGYGQIVDETLPEGWQVVETRDLGHQSLDWVKDQQKKWRGTTVANRDKQH